jgi:hypothetical protein
VDAQLDENREEEAEKIEALLIEQIDVLNRFRGYRFVATLWCM